MASLLTTHSTVTHEDGLIDVTPIFVRFEPVLEEDYSGEIIITSEELSKIAINVYGSIPTSFDEENEPNLNVYPNPFKNTIYIDNVSGISRVTLVNMVGQVIANLNTKGEQSVALPTGRLTKGVYLLVIQKYNGERQVERLVKE